MLANEIINHTEAVGFDASFGIAFMDAEPVQFQQGSDEKKINSVTFCLKAGNFLQIYKFQDNALDMLHCINGELTGFSSMAGTPLHHVLAYADRVKNPMIHIINMDGKETGTLTATGIFGIKSLSFSYDGKWLFSLGGLPTFRLSAYSWQDLNEVVFMTFKSPIGNQISVSPIHSHLFAVYGDEDIDLPSLPEDLDAPSPPHLRFFTLQGSKQYYSFVQVDSEVDSPVLSIAWSPHDTCYVSTTDGRILVVDPTNGKIIGQPFPLTKLGDNDQNATALLCTSKYIIISTTHNNLYWISYEDFQDPDGLEKKLNTENCPFVIDTEYPMLFLSLFPHSNTLVYGRSDNCLISVDLEPTEPCPPAGQPTIQNSMISLKEAHLGPVTSIAALPHHIVTAGYDGKMRIWSIDPFLALVDRQSFKGEHFTCMTNSQGGSLVALGSESGVVRIMNSKDPENMVLLFRERLHTGPVSSIVITDRHIVSGSTDGTVAVLLADPVHIFPLVGLLTLKTAIVSLSAPPPLAQTPQLLIATSHREVIRIDLPESAEANGQNGYRIPIESLNRAMLKVSTRIEMIKCEPNLREDQQYFYCACEDKTIKYFCMPITTGDLDIVGVDDVECSAPDDTFSGHPMSVTAIALSPSQRFVASGCAGGTLIVRELDVATAQVKRQILQTTNHQPINGAISALAFSPDGTNLFSVGFDGCINSYMLKVEPQPLIVDKWATSMPNGYFKTSISHVFGIEQTLRNLTELWQDREYNTSNVEEENGFGEDDGNGLEETSLAMQLHSEKLKQQASQAADFREKIMSIRNQISDEYMKLVKANDEAPELEKLSKNEFTIDIANAEKQEQSANLQAQIVYTRRKVKNQIRAMYIQMITSRCFTPFEPKLTTIFAFKLPVSFDNFPLPVLTPKSKRILHCVSLLRRTEIAALRYRPPANDPNRVGISNNQDTSLDGARYLHSRSNSLVHIVQTEIPDNEVVVKDDAKLLYDPFSLLTGNRKVTQIIIAQHIIMEEMTKFNTIFEEMLSKKQSLVQSLDEKNKRIKQLIRILKLNPDDYTLFTPEPQEDEIAESFLTVKDEEVHLKKGLDTLSKTQEKADEVDKDSFAEKALRAMMGGNVNMNSIEEAPADDEPQRPEWMNTKKKEEMTEEEQYQVAEFEKKLKNFIEEREKRRKALNAELTKLLKNTISSVEEFDREMCKAYMQRFDTEEKVYYHELEIMHLMQALHDERITRQKLANILDEAYNLGAQRRQQQPLLTDITAECGNFTKQAQTADENLDSLKNQVQKEFKNKECFSQLMRLYNSISRRIKPKISNGPNVFDQFLQPPLVFTDDAGELQHNQPKGLADAPWKNFLEYCDAKIRLSRDAAEKNQDAAELKARVATFNAEMEKIDQRIQDLEQEQTDATDNLLQTLIDLHIPFTFRQGQVEIPSDQILINYNDVVLINKKLVTDRNKLILEAGKRKVDELENIRQQRADHKVLKWEIDKCKVDLENLNEEVKEYQLFRVTKNDQELINGGGKNRNQKKVDSLHNSKEHTKQTHQIRMQRAHKNLKLLKTKIQKKKEENDKVEEEILQMQLSLKERKRIYNIQMKGNEGANEARRRRLKQVMMVSRLKRAKQVQESRIAELTEEVARLRKCVYTSFNEGEDFEAMVGYNH